MASIRRWWLIALVFAIASTLGMLVSMRGSRSAVAVPEVAIRPAEPAQAAPATPAAESDPAAGVADPAAEAALIAESWTPTDADGMYERVRIGRTDRKYRQVRIEERPRARPGLEAPVLVDCAEMVADHLIVSIRPDQSRADLERGADGISATIRDFSPQAHLALIAFDGTEPGSMARVRGELARQALAHPEPDYIVSPADDT